MVNNYIPAGSFKVDPRIPDTLPDYTQPVFTPKEETPEESVEFFDEPDYTQEVAQGIRDTLSETPRLTRSEAEEQMHLVELRRLAEAYTANDARVISQVLAKKYATIMFVALHDEYVNMKNIVDTVTGAVKDADQT